MKRTITKISPRPEVAYTLSVLEMRRRVILGAVFFDDTHAHRVAGSHLAAPRSDLSNQTKLAERHSPASVLRGSGGVKREAG